MPLQSISVTLVTTWALQIRRVYVVKEYGLRLSLFAKFMVCILNLVIHLFIFILFAFKWIICI